MIRSANRASSRDTTTTTPNVSLSSLSASGPPIASVRPLSKNRNASTCEQLEPSERSFRNSFTSVVAPSLATNGHSNVATFTFDSESSLGSTTPYVTSATRNTVSSSSAETISCRSVASPFSTRVAVDRTRTTSPSVAAREYLQFSIFTHLARAKSNPDPSLPVPVPVPVPVVDARANASHACAKNPKYLA